MPGGIHQDEPACPSCGYALAGLTSGRCPECSCELGDDVSVHVPRRAGIVLDDWSALTWARAAAGVMALPFRSIAPSRTDRLRAWPAIAFAALWTIACLLTYQVVKTLPHLVLAVYSSRPMAPVWSSFVSWYAVARGACWEAWSIARWWILALALSAGWSMLRSIRRAQPTAGRSAPGAILSTLLLAPWISLIEWWSPIAPALTDPRVVAEPGTIFVGNWDWTRWAQDPWPTRCVAVAFAAFAWARIGARLRWPVALTVAVVAAVLGSVASVSWSYLWTRLLNAGWPLLPTLRP